jgi:PIN domain nuclease of toxin-antitoxin system
MAIKHSIGKLDLTVDLKTIFSLIQESGLKILPITPAHILKSAILPFHHRDPFDRLMIGQALNEDLTLISRDEAFANYDVTLLW